MRAVSVGLHGFLGLGLRGQKLSVVFVYLVLVLSLCARQARVNNNSMPYVVLYDDYDDDDQYCTS